MSDTPFKVLEFIYLSECGITFEQYCSVCRYFHGEFRFIRIKDYEAMNALKVEFQLPIKIVTVTMPAPASCIA